MVSFSCENCGDVLTKKKLDAHRGRCHGASFTCLDCMVHFHGTDYRSHTSCMSEAQKYQGALYKEKPAKNKNQNRKSIADQPHNNENSALVPRRAYVEDVHEETDAPPTVPSPPPNPPISKAGPVNVFDFLVAEKSPNVSQLSFASPKEQMTMKKGAPSVFTDSNKQLKDKNAGSEEHTKSSRQYEEEGFSYGTQPIKPSPRAPNASLTSLDIKTPVAKSLQNSIKEKDGPSHSRQDSGNLSDRKRKRGHVDPLDLSATNGNSQESVRFELEGDTLMRDAPHTVSKTPQALVHSGLTGGLNRLLSDSTFPPSPDYSDEKEKVTGRADPISPLKRSKHTKESDSNGMGISIKGRAGRAGRIMSLIGVAGASATSSSINPERALVRTRRRASSSESGQRSGGDNHDRDRDRERRPRKHHRVHHVSSHGTSSAHTHHRSSRRHASNSTATSDAPSRKLKAIEYHRHSPVDYSNSESDDSDYDPADRRSSSKSKHSSQQQVVRYNADTAALTKSRSEHFLSFVNKGPDSEKGLSVNKCLKRWHRENVTSTERGRVSRDVKLEEEKELWRGLRLKRNDRGEVVVFF